MTGDEYVTEVYNQQGFVIFAGRYAVEIGAFIGEAVAHRDRSKCTFPMRVISTASKEEYRRQLVLADKILPSSTNVLEVAEDLTHFYRVEVAD